MDIHGLLMLYPHILLLNISCGYSEVKVQGSTNRWAPGCVDAAGKLRQKWWARAGTKFTKPRARLLVEPCTDVSPVCPGCIQTVHYATICVEIK